VDLGGAVLSQRSEGEGRQSMHVGRPYPLPRMCSDATCKYWVGWVGLLSFEAGRVDRPMSCNLLRVEVGLGRVHPH
jgi:hypothetical protein